MIEPEEAESLRTLLVAWTRKANYPEGIAQIENLSDEWRGMIKAQVRAIKTEQRYSWADIARPLGINRSAAQQRYGDHREAS